MTSLEELLGISPRRSSPMEDLNELKLELAKVVLASKDFTPMPPKAQDQWRTVLKALNEVDPSEIDTVALILVKKSDERFKSEPCPGCGKVHKSDAMGAMIVRMGDAHTLDAAVFVLGAESNKDGEHTNLFA